MTLTPVKRVFVHVGATVAAVGLAVAPAVPAIAHFLPPPWNFVASAVIAGIQGVVAYRSSKSSKSTKPVSKPK